MAAKAQATGRWRFLLSHVAFSPAVFAKPPRTPGSCCAWAGAGRGFPIAANIAVQYRLFLIDVLLFNSYIFTVISYTTIFPYATTICVATTIHMQQALLQMPSAVASPIEGLPHPSGFHRLEIWAPYGEPGKAVSNNRRMRFV
ncbi:MAG TPA: hypothetical protein VIH87_06435 [Methylocella sp.]